MQIYLEKDLVNILKMREGKFVIPFEYCDTSKKTAPIGICQAILIPPHNLHVDSNLDGLEKEKEILRKISSMYNPFVTTKTSERGRIGTLCNR